MLMMISQLLARKVPEAHQRSQRRPRATVTLGSPSTSLSAAMWHLRPEVRGKNRDARIPPVGAAARQATLHSLLRLCSPSGVWSSSCSLNQAAANLIRPQPRIETNCTYCLLRQISLCFKMLQSHLCTCRCKWEKRDLLETKLFLGVKILFSCNHRNIVENPVWFRTEAAALRMRDLLNAATRNLL